MLMRVRRAYAERPQGHGPPGNFQRPQVAGEVIGGGQGVGVVVAEDPPAAGEGVFVQGAGGRGVA